MVKYIYHISILLATYHTVDTEQECGDTEPQSNASAFMWDISDIVFPDRTEHMMVSKAKHIHHL